MKKIGLFVFLFLIVISGCDGVGGSSSTTTTTTKKVEKEPSTEQQLLDGQTAILQKMRELEGRFKVREFRGLANGIPIGKGVLRIVIPQDDEGNDVMSLPQMVEELVDATSEVKKAANKKEGDPPVVAPPPTKRTKKKPATEDPAENPPPPPSST